MPPVDWDASLARLLTNYAVKLTESKQAVLACRVPYQSTSKGGSDA